MTQKPRSVPVEAPVEVRSDAFRGVLLALFYLLIFLAGVHGLGDGFKMLGRDLLDSFFSATENPLIALMVGILATTIVQSSSVTTSMVVALVAAPENPLPLANAVPMILGANIGTTVTNTFVSMAYVGRRDEFQRAFAVATCHDFFNFLTVALLLPLELLTGYLQNTAAMAARWLGPAAPGLDYDSPLKVVLKVLLAPVVGLAEWALPENAQWQGVIIAVVSVGLIFVALAQLVRTLRRRLQRQMERLVEGTLAKSGLLGILVGVLVTAAVQSSSITTSLLVPLAGAGILTLNQAFPVTLGANIGTTLTALLASLAVSGPNATAGVTIALVHLLFNLTGTIVIYPFPPIRRIPLALAEGLAGIAARSRRWAVAYVVVLFYGLPALLAFFDR